MARVLFHTWDGGGNTPPTVGIASELARRGHQVCVLGHAQQESVFVAAGLEFEPMRHARPWSALGSANPAAMARMCFDKRSGLDLLEVAARHAADLVVIDAYLAAALRAAEHHGLGRAVLMHTLIAAGPRVVQAMARITRRRWARTDLVLVATDREFEVPPPPASFRYTGVVWQDPEPRPHTPPDGEPQVLVSLSTVNFPAQAGTLQRVMDALGGLPVHGIVTTGPAISHAGLRVPANVELAGTIPHGQLLPRTTALVGHGGHATTMRALLHDVPVVVLPSDNRTDQPTIGRRLQERGAGVLLPRSATVNRIQNAVIAALDTRTQAAAAAVGARLRQRDGAIDAADHLESIVATPRAARHD